MERSINNNEMMCEHFNSESWGEILIYGLQKNVVATKEEDMVVLVLVDQNKQPIHTMAVQKLGTVEGENWHGQKEMFDEVVIIIDGKQEGNALRKWSNICRKENAKIAA